MSKPTLALIPSGQKATKVYSVLPSDGTGDFTFARTGDATRVRKDGLIETVATTLPRLDWLNSDCPNLLIEPERTNRQIRSEQFDNAAWTKQADITVTANQVTAPTGELTADKIQRGSTTNTNNYVGDAASKSSSAQLDACSSVFVKQGEGDFFAFRITGTYPNRADAIFQFSNTTLTTSVAGADFTVTSSKVENYGNGWYRLSVVYNTDAAATISSTFSPRGSSGVIDATDTSTDAFVYLWGCQVEEGASLTSYIETPADAAVTRNADVCVVNPPSDVVKITETFADDTTNVITTIPVSGELVTNGDFATDSDWTKGTGWSIAGGVAVAVAGSASYLNQNIGGQSGKKYMVKIDVVRTAGTVFVFFGQFGGTFVSITSSGSYTFINDWTSNSNIGIYKDASFVGSVDNVSVKEVYQINNGRIKNVIII